MVMALWKNLANVYWMNPMTSRRQFLQLLRIHVGIDNLHDRPLSAYQANNMIYSNRREWTIDSRPFIDLG